jgi:hypothetical protein
MQAGTAVALLAGSAGLSDKVNDGDAPGWLRPIASRSARHLAAVGTATAAACGLDGTDVSAAPDRARVVEATAGAGLDELLEPAGTAVAAMFSHTAIAAGMPANTAALRQMGDAFGRLVHLVDAAEDRESDHRNGRFNPLDATGTDHDAAGELARCLHAVILRSLDDCQLADGALAQALLGPTLAAAIGRTWPTKSVSAPAHGRRGGVVVGVAAALLANTALFGGGRRGGRWGRDPYDPYYGGYGGYGRRRGCGGPSCGQILACDCCANCACNECCGGDDCCCCCI